MTPQFHPALVNDPFGDPAVYVDFLLERRAILFDLGEITSLPPRKILRLSHIFVSHTHIDHFIGFDHLVRIFLGRDKRLHLFGPPGFVRQVESRLAAYTWNLVRNYPTDFTLVATEIDADGSTSCAEFHCIHGFAREKACSARSQGGILLDDETFLVRAITLDHKVPVLAFALEEKQHVNIMKNRLDEMGVPVGPWLAELKRAVLRGDSDDLTFTAHWHEDGRSIERKFRLGELKDKVLQMVPGQKIAYVTDVGFNAENTARIVELARGADTLFIEATFLDSEAERAADKSHLTARQAGELARQAGVVRVIPFHFSPRYLGREEELRGEVEVGFQV